MVDDANESEVQTSGYQQADREEFSKLLKITKWLLPRTLRSGVRNYLL